MICDEGGKTMAVKLKGLSDTQVSGVMRSVVKGSGTPENAGKRVEAAFLPQPHVDFVKTKGVHQVDIMVTFPCGARHGATCDL